MTNILSLPEITITITTPRGDSWAEALQYFFSDGTTPIDLTGIFFEFQLHDGYSPRSVPMLSFTTQNFAYLVPTGNTKSIIAWNVPDYVMKKLDGAPSSLDLRCFVKADGYRLTAMTGTLQLT